MKDPGDRANGPGARTTLQGATAMADSTNPGPAGEEGGTVARALRATTATVDRAGRNFIDHTRDCGPCRTRGEDCPDAASLREIWRIAREAATP